MQRKSKSARTVLTLYNSVPGSMTARASNILHGASAIYTPAADEPQVVERTSATGPSKKADAAAPGPPAPPAKAQAQPKQLKRSGACEAELAMCRDDLAANETRRASLEGEKQKAESELVTARKAKEGDKQKAESELLTARKEKEDAKAMLVTCRIQVTQKNAEIAQKNAEIDTALLAAQAARDSLQTVRQEASECKRNLVNLQTRLSDTDNKLTEKDQRSSGLSEELAQVKLDLAQAKMSMSEANGLGDEITRIKTELITCNDEKRKLIAERELLSKGKQDEEQKLQVKEKDAKTLRAQLDALKLEFTDLITERDDAKREAQELKAELQTMKIKVDKQEQLLADQEERHIKHTERIQDAIENERTQAQQDTSGLQQRLQDSTQEQARLTSELIEQKRAVEEVERAMEQQRQQRAEDTQKLRDLEAHLQHSREEVSNKEQTIDELRIYTEALTAQIREAEMKLTEHTGSSQAREKEISEELQTAKTELEAARRQFTEKQMHLNETKDRLSKLEQKSQSSTEGVRELRMLLGTAKGEIQTAKQKTQDAVRDNETKSALLATLNEDKTKLEADLAEALNDVTKLSALRLEWERGKERIIAERDLTRDKADRFQEMLMEAANEINIATREANKQADIAAEAERKAATAVAAQAACKTAAVALEQEMRIAQELADQAKQRADDADGRIKEVESELSRKTEQLEADARRGEELLREIKRNGAAWYWQNEEEQFETLLGTDFGLTRPIANLEQTAQLIKDETNKLIPSVLKSLGDKCSLVTKGECSDCNEMLMMPKADVMRRIASHARWLHAKSGATKGSASVFLRESKSELERRLGVSTKTDEAGKPVDAEEETFFDSEQHEQSDDEQFFDMDDEDANAAEKKAGMKRGGFTKEHAWNPITVLAAAYSLSETKLRMLKEFSSFGPSYSSKIRKWDDLLNRAAALFERWTGERPFNINATPTRIFDATLYNRYRPDGNNELRRQMLNWIESSNQNKEDKKDTDVFMLVWEMIREAINEIDASHSAYISSSIDFFAAYHSAQISALYLEIEHFTEQTKDATQEQKKEKYENYQKTPSSRLSFYHQALTKEIEREKSHDDRVQADKRTLMRYDIERVAEAVSKEKWSENEPDLYEVQDLINELCEKKTAHYSKKARDARRRNADRNMYKPDKELDLHVRRWNMRVSRSSHLSTLVYFINSAFEEVGMETRIKEKQLSDATERERLIPMIIAMRDIANPAGLEAMNPEQQYVALQASYDQAYKTAVEQRVKAAEAADVKESTVLQKIKSALFSGT
jgi:hypothetical protein